MRKTALPHLSAAFEEKGTLSKAELLQRLQEVYPAASGPTLTWRISDLKSQGVLRSPARGLYQLGQSGVFEPVLSEVSQQIAAVLRRELPLVKSCIWETRWLSAWMQLQPPAQWVVVEVEKQVCERVFYLLKDAWNSVFLDPDPNVVERYMLALSEAIVVMPLLSEAPVFSAGPIPTASIEKILVDIVAEPNLFRAQASEWENIYAAAFRELPVNQSKLMRYASRRRKSQDVLQLIPAEHRLNPLAAPLP